MICLHHGLSYGKHKCLYCCLCFKTLHPEECHITKDGQKEDVCIDCSAKEEEEGKQRAKALLEKWIEFSTRELEVGELISQTRWFLSRCGW